MTRSETLRAILEKDPGDSFSRYALAMELVGAQRWTEAIAEFTDLQRRDPSYVALYYQLGKCYEQNNQPQDAIAAYTEGIRVARQANNMHAVSELYAAKEELEDTLA